MLKDIRSHLIIYKNRYLSTHGLIYNDFVYFINRLSKILHIKTSHLNYKN